ncbi:MAG: ZIP family metal transporter [Bacteroidales bacterium]|nr:ZIP family metal transporter [Bacteroidales bacterium]MBN2819942.1 ZIP family metal transporter [Bacteroidales bacterium]
MYILIALMLGSVGSILLASALLLLSKSKLELVSTYLISVAGGTLLGAAFLGMIPKAIQVLQKPELALGLTLSGIILFFVVEKFILWRSCGNKECERYNSASAPLILLGDALHNFIDGIIITAAFFTSVEFGVIVTLTVFAHEIPQELADFGVLIHNGYSKKKALKFNLISGLTTLVGGLLAYVVLETAERLIPFVLSFSAASFIYIALADLVPQMHSKTKLTDSIIQLLLILLGVLIIYLIKRV